MFGPLSEAAPAPPMTSRVQERKPVRRAADGYVPARHFFSQIGDAFELARFNVQVRRLEVDRDVDLMDAINDAWYRRP